MSNHHPHAKVLRAIADGKEVQVYLGEWGVYKDYNPIAHPHYRWRVKPDRLLVNGVDCPVEELDEGALTYRVSLSLPSMGYERDLKFATVDEAALVYRALLKPFEEGK